MRGLARATALTLAIASTAYSGNLPDRGGALVLTQGAVTIPSDADLERMEERAIATPPLDTSGTPRLQGSDEDKIRQMDERARRIDERLIEGGSICKDCK